jgi:hypothetical protein
VLDGGDWLCPSLSIVQKGPIQHPLLRCPVLLYRHRPCLPHRQHLPLPQQAHLVGLVRRIQQYNDSTAPACTDPLGLCGLKCRLDDYAGRWRSIDWQRRVKSERCHNAKPHFTCGPCLSKLRFPGLHLRPLPVCWLPKERQTRRSQTGQDEHLHHRPLRRIAVDSTSINIQAGRNCTRRVWLFDGARSLLWGVGICSGDIGALGARRIPPRKVDCKWRVTLRDSK